MGQTALLPSEGRGAEDFFALKNPKASVGFEPANLGTKGHNVMLDDCFIYNIISIKVSFILSS